MGGNVESKGTASAGAGGEHGRKGTYRIKYHKVGNDACQHAHTYQRQNGINEERRGSGINDECIYKATQH